MTVRFSKRQLDDVLNGPAVQDELERHARRVADLASGGHGASRLTFSTRKGRGPQGAFAQTIMRGDGAVAIEFGSRNNPPYAPLRRALRGEA